MRPRLVLDLFAGGAGGWSLGLHRAGWRTVAAAEWDDQRRVMFGDANPGAALYADVRDVTAARLRSDLGYLPDIVVGSPPCQDISAANASGAGTGGARSGLFWEWLRIVDEVRPDWACAENSPRLRTLGGDDILAGLEAIGYACWPLVVGADDAGANHRRDRVWIVARNAQSIGRRESRPEPVAEGRRAHAGIGGVARHPDRCDESSVGGSCGRASAEPDGVAADAHGTGHALGSRRPGDDGSELPAALRDIGRAWPHWNGGEAGLAASCAAAGTHRVDDGVSARLVARARNQCIAAYGDAVVPRITEAIARAIDAADALLYPHTRSAA